MLCWLKTVLVVFVFLLFCGCSHSDKPIVLYFVDEAGKPIANVQNRIYGKDFPNHIVLISDQEGICTLDFSQIKTKGRSFQIYTNHPDYVSLRCSFGDWGIEPTPNKYTFRLERGREIGGVIVDEQGKPVEDATVDVSYCIGIERDGRVIKYAEPDEPFPYPAPLSQVPKTDSEGRWTVTQIPSKKFYPLALRVSASGFAPLRVEIEQEGESFQSLLDKSHNTVLSPGAKLVGKLVAEGNPNLEQTVLHVRRGGCLHTHNLAVSASGEFSMNDLVPGTYTLQIVPEHHAPMIVSETISVDSKPIEVPLTFGKPLRFHVTDPKGKPVAGVEIRSIILRGAHTTDNFINLNSLTKTSDTEGRMVWENAPEIPASYSFYHQDYLVATSPDWTPQEEAYSVVMCPKLTIRGKVVDAKTKRAVPMFGAAILGRWALSERELEEVKDYDEKELEESGIDLEQGVILIGIGGVWPYVKGDTAYSIVPTLYAERCIVVITADGYEPATSEEFSLTDGDRQFNFELKKLPK